MPLEVLINRQALAAFIVYEENDEDGIMEMLRTVGGDDDARAFNLPCDEEGTRYCLERGLLPQWRMIETNWPAIAAVRSYLENLAGTVAGDAVER